MIDGNVIRFGYGTVCSGACSLDRTIIFRHIRPPKKLGESVRIDEVEELGEKIVIALDLDLYREYKKNLESVEAGNINEFQFCGYTFDFSNYDVKSINVCRQKAEAAMMLYFMAMAA